MKIFFWSPGGRHQPRFLQATDDYTARIGHYYACEWKFPPPPKHAASLSPEDTAMGESQVILEAIDPADYLVLLDERGKMLSSPDLAGLIEQRALQGSKRIHFVIGGAYGVSQALRTRANLVWQLSKLVFPHQLVRLILAEQVYRACTIIRGEKYHHA